MDASSSGSGDMLRSSHMPGEEVSAGYGDTDKGRREDGERECDESSPEAVGGRGGDTDGAVVGENCCEEWVSASFSIADCSSSLGDPDRRRIRGNGS